MIKKDAYEVAVAGATGAVGRAMLAILEERQFPVANLTCLASARSAGSTLPFRGKEVEVRELTRDSFKGIDIALFSAGGGTSKEFAPAAVEAGCVVIDNSSAWRMEPGVPLVVPEINAHAIGGEPGIIANPNCSTIQMVMALKPIHDLYKIRRVVVSTYQSVSGSGQKAMDELGQQMQQLQEGKGVHPSVYPHQIAYNCLPHIDVFLENGYTKEEMKMINETRKIMEDDSIDVSPTTVRVPVMISHSEAVNVECEQEIDLERVRESLAAFPGVVVVDSPGKNEYPLAIDAAGKDEVQVGRIRLDLGNPRCLNLWVVADNLRKGAALNAVQIAEALVRR
ncbi:MAG: aspartate-semialdehyde dehydrogenase [Nitrospina sp.]|nr:aspartate-semialdehyde dehydrogenase [Nitrospina sp.]